MGANRYVVDSGGVTRHIRKRYVIDSGGVTRLIKKRYIIDAGGAGRLTYLGAEPFTGVAGSLANVGSGFSSAFDFGTLNGQPAGVPMALHSSVPLAPGFANLFLTAIYNPTAHSALLEVDGFASDPGASWLFDFIIGSSTYKPTDAGATYSFAVSPHAAVWRWTSAFPLSPFSGSISHN